MARILCNKSGISFQVEHFPIHFTSGELHHPIFDAPLKRLWKLIPKWQNGELSQTDSYLYFLSLLHSTDLVEFRTAAQQHSKTAKIVASNMPSLIETIGHISAIRNPHFILPRFVISHDTRTLDNVKHWLAIWNERYSDFCQGLKDQDTRSKLQKREAVLERLIRNPAIHPQKYAHLLAQWAAIAASFPEFTLTVSGSTISCSEYWQDLIIKAYNSVDVIQMNKSDLDELITHCEEQIELGSIYSYQLFTTLRAAQNTIENFFGNPFGSTTFSILGSNDDVGDSNLQLLINDAPTSQPKRTEYATEFAFLRAKMKWSLAQAQAAQNKKDEDKGEGVN